MVTTFQLKTTAAERPRTLKRTALYLRSVSTLRFEWLNQAARLFRPGAKANLAGSAGDGVWLPWSQVMAWS
jgi:hypothetical protein